MTHSPPLRAAPSAGARASRSSLAALLCVVLASCSLTRSPPVKETYLLEPAMPAAVARTQPLSVRVAGVNVAAPFRGRQFIYRVNALRYETDYYSEFLVAPGAMLTEQTVRALEAARVFSRVVPPGSGADADVELEGFASALHADAKEVGTPSSAELAITYYATSHAAGATTPGWSKEYRRQVPLAQQTPAGYAAALNGAFGDILAELTRDLAAADFGKR
jgi:cholesterol transport system auxiliary component